MTSPAALQSWSLTVASEAETRLVAECFAAKAAAGDTFTLSGTYQYLIVKFGDYSLQGLDNVILVPEPATMGLLLLGGAAIIRRRRR